MRIKNAVSKDLASEKLLCRCWCVCQALASLLSPLRREEKGEKYTRTTNYYETYVITNNTDDRVMNRRGNENMKWYVCFCEPKRAKEFCSVSGGIAAGFYCPTMLLRRRDPRANKTRIVELPLISGIFFCRTDAWATNRGIVAGVDTANITRMKNGSGSLGLVTDAELQGLRLSAAAVSRRHQQLNPGEHVNVEFGVLAGFAGKVMATRDEEHTVLLDNGLKIKIRGFLLRRTGL